MKTNIIRIILLILIILNCFIIFKFSSEVSEDSSSRSGRVVAFISNIIPSIKNMNEEDRTLFQEEVMQPIVRKIAHFTIYTSLGFLSISFMLTFKNKYLKYGIISLMFGITYATSDEIHQYFVQGRSCQFTDICIDTLGVFIGILISTLTIKIISKITEKVKE